MKPRTKAEPSKPLAVRQRENGVGLTQEQTELVKRTIAKGASDDELALFLYQAKRLRLDPLARQIHLVPIWDSEQNAYVRVTVVGIDGLRLIAERTGQYRPDEKAPRFTYDDTGALRSAKVKIWKYHPETQQWHAAEEEARFAEYARRRKDGAVIRNWATMPHVMLAKVAEARALRKAFPMDLSGVYAEEEIETLPRTPAELPASGAQSELLLPTDNQATKDQREAIHRFWQGKLRDSFKSHEIADQALDRWLAFNFGVRSTTQLTFAQASQAITSLQKAEQNELLALANDLLKLPADDTP